jgi:hypothetical protein
VRQGERLEKGLGQRRRDREDRRRSRREEKKRKKKKKDEGVNEIRKKKEASR